MSKFGAVRARRLLSASMLAFSLPPSGILALCLVSFIYLGISPAWSADLEKAVAFNIPAQPLESALLEFGKQAQVPVVIGPDINRSFNAPSVTGILPVRTALIALLDESGLQFKTVADTVTVTRVAAKSASASSRIASVEGSSSASAPDALAAVDLQEIVVTAEKRLERPQDVPIPLTVVNVDKLADNDEVRLQDYYASVPGLSVTPAVQSALNLSIRGVTTGGASNPTVGITVDDIPYGASTSNGGGAVVPDIDPGDLARVEVLRGPQGTLYGASSMGGLIKFVTVDPSTDAASGRIQVGASSVHNGAEPGYNVRGSINVPITDDLAIRASAFTRQDPGYINNSVLFIKGVNEDHVHGGRLAVLWRPSDAFSVKVSALVQETKGDGSNDVNMATNGYTGPTLGDLQQNYLPGIGGYDRKIQAYSATATAHFGSVELTSLTGYNINSFKDSLDLTYSVGSCCTQYIYDGVMGTPEFENNSTRKFTEEIRASIPLGTKLEWLIGFFYTHESSEWTQILQGEDAATGELFGPQDFTNFPSTYAEYAAFTDFTVHITDRFDIQVGGRESHINQTSNLSEAGPFVPYFYGQPSPYIQPQVNARANAFTYVVTPRLKITPNMMAYARLASGYRAGGPNAAAGEPSQYNPDKTLNYEIGVKTDFLARKLSIDASAYYIDWKNIQLALTNPDNYEGYNANAGGAKSEGMELSVEARPMQGLTLGAWVALNNAVLTEGFPSISNAYGASGDRLPYTSRFSSNVSIQQDFPVLRDVTGFVGGEVSYVGDRLAVFTASTQRQDLPAYAKFDLRAGARFGKSTFNVFVTNITDRRGLLNGGLGYFPPFGFTYIQPRTVGFSLTQSF